MSSTTVRIDSISVTKGAPLLFIGGPCALEGESVDFQTATRLKEICRKLAIPYVFKGSFDKANRTSLSSPRGVGMEQGLAILEHIRKELEIPVLTDVHTVEQISVVAEVVDIIQIPAFLCRQTDLLVAAGKSDRVVNIKKGQFLSPGAMKFAVEKVTSTGNEKVLLTERGSFFGYGDLVVDMRALQVMSEFGFPVIFDAGHSVQQPGGAGGETSGARDFIPLLARAAVGAGCQGIYLEVHPEPNKSPSDKNSIWPLDRVETLLTELVALYEVRWNGEWNNA